MQDKDFYLNFTEVRNKTEFANLMAPRLLFDQVTSSDLEQYGPIHLAYLDTNLERSLSIGVDYPFTTLQEGECIVPEKFRLANDTL